MYDLCKILHNPFGNRRVDVAHEAIQGGLDKLAKELITNGEKLLPPGMLAVYPPGGIDSGVVSTQDYGDDEDDDDNKGEEHLCSTSAPLSASFMNLPTAQISNFSSSLA